MKRFLAAAAFAALGSAQAGAAVIAASDFTSGNDGWEIGEFTSLGSTLVANHDAVNGRINTTDTFGNVAFIAPAAYLGNQSAAFGGTISFKVGDNENDSPSLYSPLALISGSTVLFANRVLPPAIANTGSDPLTSFSITLTGVNFITSSPFSAGGVTATDAELQAVLANLQRVAILADWNTGSDFSQLDNVVLSNTLSGGVPEPATWAMMLIGFAGLGYAARRRKAEAAA